QMFNRPEDARAEFERAISIASANHFNQMVMNAEQGLQALRDGVAPQMKESVQPSTAVVDVAAAIHEMRTLAGVGG
ncbi:MAG TPA: hypothetical protein VIQ74_10575, partial [Gemmatimonadaceae bacterium]